LQLGALALLVLLLHLLAQIQDGPAGLIVGKSMGRGRQGGKHQASGHKQGTQGQNVIAHENSRVKKQTSGRPADRPDAW
jgi:hypothetical protein